MDCPKCGAKTVVRSRLRSGVERTSVWRLFFYALRCQVCEHRFRRVKGGWLALALLIAFAIATLYVTARFLDAWHRPSGQVEEPNVPI
jgi:hypothetical protein